MDNEEEDDDLLAMQTFPLDSLDLCDTMGPKSCRSEEEHLVCRIERTCHLPKRHTPPCEWDIGGW